MKTLLIRPGAIGDCLLSFPALEFLACAASPENTELWIPSALVPLVSFANRVRPLASTGLDLLEIPGPGASRVIEALKQFDSIVSFYGAARPEFRDAAARHGFPFRFLPALPPEDSALHAADFFLLAAGGLPPAVPRLPLPSAPASGAILIHPFSGSPRKNWPLHRFRALAARLDAPVLWSRGPDDPPLPEAQPVIPLDALARQVAAASLYIGNDSGITHLAAAAGAPVLALFGPTDPAVWSPRGRRVEVLRAPLEALGVDTVLQAARRLLAFNESAQTV